MKFILCFFLLILFSSALSQAQRLYNISDSTTYVIGSDTVVAGRYNLYRLQQGQLQSFADFYNPSNPNRFIRDFDFWNNQHFFVVLGSRYIGGATELQISLDGGVVWQQDTLLTPYSFNPSQPSLIGLQTYGDSTMYAFDGYYESVVIVSHNRGQTWHKWFSGQIAHWFQFMICDNGKHYLMSMGGDAFGGHMYLVPDSLFGQLDVYHFIPFADRLLLLQSDVHYVEPFFLQHRDSLCNLTLQAQETVPSETQISIYPNPAEQEVTVRFGAGMPVQEITILNVLGQVVYQKRVENNQQQLQVNLPQLAAGVYLL